VRKPVLQGVSSSAQPGQLCALMGPSGSGKTSLLSVIAGFVDAAHVTGEGATPLSCAFRS
jgi:ABC-type Fe3+/spermidine/putrescine transport system ATPase subunit